MVRQPFWQRLSFSCQGFHSADCTPAAGKEDSLFLDTFALQRKSVKELMTGVAASESSAGALLPAAAKF
jgi:hypothetical protein